MNFERSSPTWALNLDWFGEILDNGDRLIEKGGVSPADHFWQDLFCNFRIMLFRELKVVESPGHLNHAQHIAWLPPECPEGFETTEVWPWHILDVAHSGGNNLFRQVYDGQQNPLHTLPPNIELHDTTSLFFSTELNSFLEVPYDCTQDHVFERRRADERDGWTRVTFKKIERETGIINHPSLWMIGHALGKNQIDADVYINDTWNELLLPGCFSNGVHRRNAQPTCALVGKFTMIFGTVAFAADPQDLIEMIRESFRYQGTTHYRPTWRSDREKDLGLVPKRGIIVDVAFDTKKHSKEVIEQWECGSFGPILTSNATWNIPRPRPNILIQPAMTYASVV